VTGQLGTLICGEQIGGFYDWEITLSLIRLNSPDGHIYKTQQIKATARKYFYFSEPSNEIIANYYQLIKGRLVLMASHKVILSGQEMIWMN
jgi:CRISPR/Cas system endoribonuclease Cas6 (RAMP superfamily)